MNIKQANKASKLETNDLESHDVSHKKEANRKFNVLYRQLKVPYISESYERRRRGYEINHRKG